jgi:tRNA 2-selenouridine synthase
MLSKRVTASEFIDLSSTTPVVDTRSPSEFARGHIPGAINIPLFSDSERAAVGLTYKQKGRREAVMQGLSAVGPQLNGKMAEGIRAAKSERLLIYCWRGGMRSESMAWLFSLAGLSITLLEGGYKAYRSHILEDLSAERNLLILGGLTGSGKTSILKTLSRQGEQVIDLEGLASHRGSAFGALGQGAQPTTEHFANLLFNELRHTDRLRTIWLEDESRNIGSVFIPEPFWRNMEMAPVIALLSDNSVRLPRLVREYSGFPPEKLTESVLRISKRLGGDRTREALEAIAKGDFDAAAAITLAYYDKAYLYSLGKHPVHQVHMIETNTDDPEINAAVIKDYAAREGLVSAV